jgi:hypothetical protein
MPSSRTLGLLALLVTPLACSSGTDAEEHPAPALSLIYEDGTQTIALRSDSGSFLIHDGDVLTARGCFSATGILPPIGLTLGFVPVDSFQPDHLYSLPAHGNPSLIASAVLANAVASPNFGRVSFDSITPTWISGQLSIEWHYAQNPDSLPQPFRLSGSFAFAPTLRIPDC